ncbi:MAG: hypothetical protein IK136_00490, partial [Oscillospiraceae bacterium]|nr:hypothetical protein [Oscillospiraceae bacterium]
YSYFVDAVIDDVINVIMEERGCSRKIASQLLFNGGYQIYATIDQDIQAKVDSVYTDLDAIPKPRNTEKQLQSAIVITDPYTGNIVAMAGGVGEKNISRGLNRATQSKRPPGSSFKPIAVYGPAMEYGYITPDTNFEDSAEVQLKGINWLPQNDSRSYTDGIVDIRTALRRSINTVSAQVLDLLTPQASYDFLTERLHITTLVEERDGKSDIGYAPLCLGQLTDGIKVREMAAAYGIFVNSGIYTEARTFTKICNSDGELVYDNIPTSNTAISEKTAYWMTVMLKDAATNGTGSEANLGFMPTAGKTGTSGDNFDRWFCGYTPYYVATVWTGFDKPSKISISGNPASQLWKKVMTLVHQDLEYKDFPKPADTKLAPVPGVRTVPVTVRGVTLNGEVLYEETKEKVIGRTFSAVPQEVENYTVLFGDERFIVVSEDPTQNVLQFTYFAAEPTEPVEPSEPGPTETDGQETPPTETQPPTETTPPTETQPPTETTPPTETQPPAETTPPTETTPPAETQPPAAEAA